MRTITPVFALLAAAALGGCKSSAPTEAPAPTATALTTASPSGGATHVPTSPAAADDGAEVLSTSPKLVVHTVHHATLWIEAGDKVIWVDPWSEGKLDGLPKADLILITDVHPDHLDEKGIDAVKKAGTVVVGPKAVADKHAGTTVIANGEKKDVAPVSLEAVAMYNLTRGPEAGKLYHDKGRGNGYVIGFAGKRIYVSGDTECTPEMRALRDVDLAYVCMNLPYTMPPSEAAECIAAFRPKVVVPYHYKGQDPKEIEPKVKAAGVAVHEHDAYR